MINVSLKDYTWKGEGMGFNNYNFIRNVVPRINDWLLKIYLNASSENENEVKKLEAIAAIIDND